MYASAPVCIRVRVCIVPCCGPPGHSVQSNDWSPLIDHASLLFSSLFLFCIFFSSLLHFLSSIIRLTLFSANIPFTYIVYILLPVFCVHLSFLFFFLLLSSPEVQGVVENVWSIHICTLHIALSIRSCRKVSVCHSVCNNVDQPGSAGSTVCDGIGFFSAWGKLCTS